MQVTCHSTNTTVPAADTMARVTAYGSLQLPQHPVFIFWVFTIYDNCKSDFIHILVRIRTYRHVYT